jgi:hypothetical protein
MTAATKISPRRCADSNSGLAIWPGSTLKDTDLLHHAGEREDGEEGDHIRVAFVEGGLVRRGGVDEAGPEAVQQRVGRLMDDDVVRETAVDRAAFS